MIVICIISALLVLYWFYMGYAACDFHQLFNEPDFKRDRARLWWLRPVYIILLLGGPASFAIEDYKARYVYRRR